MKSKGIYWFVTSLYVILVAFSTVFTSMYSEAEKVVTFLQDQKTELLQDNARLLAATAIANNHDGTDAFVLKNPLYTTSMTLPSASLDLSFYSVSEVKKDEFVDCLAILVTDLSIEDDASLINSDGYHELTATLGFSTTVTLGDTSARTFTETFITLFEDTSKLILIEFSKLVANEPIAFSEITLGYTLEDTGTTQPLGSVESSQLPLLSPENIEISQTYGETYATTPEIFYDSSYVGKLSSYNILYVKNLAIEILIIGPLTYLIFFHKHVRAKWKEKRAIRKQAEASRYEALKQEILSEPKEPRQ